MRRLSIALLGLCFAISCGDKKKAATEDEEAETEEVECEDNSDCEDGWVCLADECVSAASGAIYTDTENAVTPDKMRKHMEKANEKAEKRADEMLEGL